MIRQFRVSQVREKLYTFFESPKTGKLTQHLKLGATPPQSQKINFSEKGPCFIPKGMAASKRQPRPWE